jgi:ferric iron reductase protein FhuF
VQFERITGKRAIEELQSVTAEVRSLVPYLRTEIDIDAPLLKVGDVPSDGDRVSCEALITNENWLDIVIRDSGQRLGTEDPVVAASLFVQNYAYRVIMLAVACLTTSGAIPDSSAKSMTITMSGGRPSTVGYLASHVVMLTPRTTSLEAAMSNPEIAAEALLSIIDSAYHENVALLIDAVRRHIRVGKRLLLGNVAASSAIAFRTMEGCLGPWVQGLGELFLSSCPAELRGLGSFLSLERDDRRGWYWERTNCCLYDRLPGKAQCADCSRTPLVDRRRAYWDSLQQP